MAFQYKPGSHYFDDNGHAEYFVGQRHAYAMLNAQTRGVLIKIDPSSGQWYYGEAWTENDELKLVDKLYRTWYGEPYGQSFNYPMLNLDKLEPKELRKTDLKPFRIEYETFAEIKLRLNNTLISIKGHPFVVGKIMPGDGSFLLGVHDGKDWFGVKYKDLTDLRSIPAKYVSGNRTGWLCRFPGRVYQQGINRNNTQIRDIMGKQSLASVDVSDLCRSLRKEKDKKWDENFIGLFDTGDLKNLRLTDDIAVTHDGEDIVACYRGRTLGTVVNDDIRVLDEDDLLQGWISSAAKKAGLNLSA
jgi:hypothetical protein